MDRGPGQRRYPLVRNAHGAFRGRVPARSGTHSPQREAERFLADDGSDCDIVNVNIG
jgi:hypothetical protein